MASADTTQLRASYKAYCMAHPDNAAFLAGQYGHILRAAFACQDADMLETLVCKHHVDVNMCYPDGLFDMSSLLSHAFYRAKSEHMANRLLDLGAHVLGEDSGRHYLCAAAECGWSATVQRILARNEGNTFWRHPTRNPVIVCITSRAIDSRTRCATLQCLLGVLKPDEFIRDVHACVASNTLLSYAVETNNAECVRILLARHARVHSSENSALEHPARKGYVDTVALLLAQTQTDVNASPNIGKPVTFQRAPALAVAAEHGHVEVVRMLLAHDAINVHVQWMDYDGQSSTLLSSIDKVLRSGVDRHSERVTKLDQVTVCRAMICAAMCKQ